MPRHKWSDISETMITPSHSTAKGQTITGNQIMLQRINYRGDRGDGKNGARLHNHPEEQFFIVIEGKIRMREEGGDWVILDPGDAYHIPALVMHEMIVDGDGDGAIYQFKVRVPGHSVFDHGWAPGAKEAWERHVNQFSEMTTNYKENNPWTK